MEMEVVVDLLEEKKGEEGSERSSFGVELKVGSSSMGRPGRSAAESLLVCSGDESKAKEGGEVMESGLEVMSVGRRKKGERREAELLMSETETREGGAEKYAWERLSAGRSLGKREFLVDQGDLANKEKTI